MKSAGLISGSAIDLRDIALNRRKSYGQRSPGVQRCIATVNVATAHGLWKA
jgi:hypothetical protein